MTSRTVVHICLSSCFTDGLGFQENLLIEQDLSLGHTVYIITNTYRYESGRLRPLLNAVTFESHRGYVVIRLPYYGKQCFLTRKFTFVSHLNYILNRLKPSLVYYHCINGISMLTAAKYCYSNPQALLYVDCHEDKHNITRFKFVLPLITFIYRFCASQLIALAHRVFYINTSSKEFLQYLKLMPLSNVNQEKFKFLPLPNPSLSTPDTLSVSLPTSVPHDAIIFIHTGKFDTNKSTHILLDAFANLSFPNAYLLLAGTFSSPEYMDRCFVANP